MLPFNKIKMFEEGIFGVCGSRVYFLIHGGWDVTCRK